MENEKITREIIIVKLIEEWKKPRSGHYQHEEIHTTSTGEMVFYSFFLTYYISNFEGNNCWKSVNFVLTLVSDTDYIITYIQHATLKEYEYTSFAVHTW